MVRTTGDCFIYIIVNMFNRYNNTCFLEDRVKNPSLVRRSNPALSSRYILFSLSVMNNVCINYSSTSKRVYFCLENSTPDLFLHEQKYIGPNSVLTCNGGRHYSIRMFLPLDKTRGNPKNRLWPYIDTFTWGQFTDSLYYCASVKNYKLSSLKDNCRYFE